jgi:hypothetical protein
LLPKGEGFTIEVEAQVVSDLLVEGSLHVAPISFTYRGEKIFWWKVALISYMKGKVEGSWRYWQLIEKF